MRKAENANGKVAQGIGSGGGDGKLTEQQNPDNNPGPFDISKAYHLAGMIVAAHHSLHHYLIGDLDLAGQDGLSSFFRAVPDKGKGVQNGEKPNGMSGDLKSEQETILMAGRQAELMHYTLHSPTDSEKIIGELSRYVPQMNGYSSEFKHRVVADALDLVTHHWHEIECLAAWLIRQPLARITADKVQAQIAGIRPEDHGLFP